MGGVFGHDQVGGVGGLSSGRDGVLNVGQPDVGTPDLVASQGRVATVWELQRQSVASDVDDGGGSAVSYRPQVVMVHGVAELDLVAAEQLIRPSWNRHAIAAELAQSGFDVALA